MISRTFSLRARLAASLVPLGLAVPLQAQLQTAPLPAYRPPIVYPAIADADPVSALSRYLRMLSANPRDLSSLTGAGKAALAVGDANAALGFYARAEEIAPRNGRIKAGLASALVQMEQPRTALKLFDEAVALGVPVGEIASDRGLARDLNGDGRAAQGDYTLALRTGEDDETVRRLALSMAISGDRAGALTMLDSLLRRRDGGAVRARAFVLALTGDHAGAASAVRTAMPGPQAAVMASFMTRLVALNPAQKALAVNFGYFPSDGRSYNAAELFADARSRPAAAAPVAMAGGRTADTPLIPAGMPLGAGGMPARGIHADMAARRRPGGIEEATAEVAPPSHVLIAPVAGRPVAVAMVAAPAATMWPGVPAGVATGSRVDPATGGVVMDGPSMRAAQGLAPAARSVAGPGAGVSSRSAIAGTVGTRPSLASAAVPLANAASSSLAGGGIVAGNGSAVGPAPAAGQEAGASVMTTGRGVARPAMDAVAVAGGAVPRDGAAAGMRSAADAPATDSGMAGERMPSPVNRVMTATVQGSASNGRPAGDAYGATGSAVIGSEIPGGRVTSPAGRMVAATTASNGRSAGDVYVTTGSTVVGSKITGGQVPPPAGQTVVATTADGSASNGRSAGDAYVAMGAAAAGAEIMGGRVSPSAAPTTTQGLTSNISPAGDAHVAADAVVGDSGATGAVAMSRVGPVAGGAGGRGVASDRTSAGDVSFGADAAAIGPAGDRVLAATGSAPSAADGLAGDEPAREAYVAPADRAAVTGSGVPALSGVGAAAGRGFASRGRAVGDVSAAVNAPAAAIATTGARAVPGTGPIAVTAAGPALAGQRTAAIRRIDLPAAAPPILHTTRATVRLAQADPAMSPARALPAHRVRDILARPNASSPTKSVVDPAADERAGRDASRSRVRPADNIPAGRTARVTQEKDVTAGGKTKAATAGGAKAGKDASSRSRDKATIDPKKAKVTDVASAERDVAGKPAGKSSTKGVAAKEAGKDKTDVRPAKSKLPERYWVQVASGSNKANLDKAWDDVKGKAPKLLAGQKTYTAPWRASNRLLVGPFKTEAEAQAHVNKLARQGVSGIQFTTRAGADVETVDDRQR